MATNQYNKTRVAGSESLLFQRVILLFGKSGAGKSSVGKYLAERVNGLHISMGDFIRNYLKINPPRRKTVMGKTIFHKLVQYINNGKRYQYCILVCNPYPQDCFDGLLKFIRKYSKECLCFEIFVDNETALLRVKKRHRIEQHGYDYAERLKFYKKSIKPAISRFGKLYKIKKINNYRSIRSTAKEIESNLKIPLV